MSLKRAVLVVVGLVSLFFMGAGVSEYRKRRDGQAPNVEVALGSPAIVRPTPGEFWLHALPSIKLGFQAEKIRAEIEAHNLAQPTKCPPEFVSELANDRCAGFVHLEYFDADPYFYVLKTVTTRDHTARDGIDNGEDNLLATFFSKEPPVSEVTELGAPVHVFKNGTYVLSVPATSSCAGTIPGGEIAIYNLPRQKEIFSGKLEGAKILTVDVAEKPTPTTSRELSLELVVQSESPDPDEKSCEVGRTVLQGKEVLKLDCDLSGERCAMARVSFEQSAGCEDIGQCD